MSRPSFRQDSPSVIYTTVRRHHPATRESKSYPKLHDRLDFSLATLEEVKMRRRLLAVLGICWR